MSRQFVLFLTILACLTCPAVQEFCLAGDNSLPLVQLEEIWRIDDSGEDFYFKYSTQPNVNHRGEIFIINQEQLLHFSPDGKFIRNLYQPGQGPGEMNNLNGVFFDGADTVAWSCWPHKLLRFSPGGKLKQEIKIPENMGCGWLLSKYNSRLYVIKEVFTSTKNKAVFLDKIVKLFSTSPGDKGARFENISFPRRYFCRNNTSVKNVHFLQYCRWDERTVFIAYGGKYLIHRLDLETLKMSAFIKKVYQKIPFKEEWNKILSPFRFESDGPTGKEYKTFQYEHLDDIVRIWRNGNHLWLLTSTFDENSRRVRVDIYDAEGKEKGRVLLQMPGGFELVRLSWHGMNLRNGKLYIFESNRDGDLELVCYGLKGVPRWKEGK